MVELYQIKIETVKINNLESFLVGMDIRNVIDCLVLGQFPDGHFPDRRFPVRLFPEGQFPDGQFPEFSERTFPRRTVPRMIFPRTDISLNHIFYLLSEILK